MGSFRDWQDDRLSDLRWRVMPWLNRWRSIEGARYMACSLITNNSIEKLQGKIIDTVKTSFDYFREHPQHLAWAMMHYELLHRVGRITFQACGENPKDLILDTAAALGQGDGNLLYDAWAVTVSNYHEFPDANPNLPLEAKVNKTLDEWIALKTDERYRYHDLYPNAERVKDFLLCVIGNGMGWNKDGFLTHQGPSNVDEALFAGYTRCEEKVESSIRERILAIRNHYLISGPVLRHLNEVQENARRIYAGEDDGQVFRGNPLSRKERAKEFEETKRRIDELLTKLAAREKKDLGEILGHFEAPKPKKRKTHYPICNYSALVTMPENAHPSYVQAGIEIAHEILENPDEPDHVKPYAADFLRKKGFSFALAKLS
ncbi:MAG: hypothetical protein Q7R96_02735 [Nanoarchaeota archaeon]|nr:hypothetical protein [Nanoarchaeota archaeon]